MLQGGGSDLGTKVRGELWAGFCFFACRKNLRPTLNCFFLQGPFIGNSGWIEELERLAGDLELVGLGAMNWKNLDFSD